MCKPQVRGGDIGTSCRGPGGRGGVKSKRAAGSCLAHGSTYRKAGNFSLRVLKEDTGYPRSGRLLYCGVQGSVCQTTTKDAEAPSAKVVLLDATGGVAEARSGDVSEGQ